MKCIIFVSKDDEAVVFTRMVADFDMDVEKARYCNLKNLERIDDSEIFSFFEWLVVCSLYDKFTSKNEEVLLYIQE